ncbi:hypothetical protein EDEG_03494 [Edhazardia aedis USNM 41457]|uniref:Replication factor C subunit 1 n=1 Tax=Edhazardia aedis (strain USNM 41457) TaxID=1003232 RepID=J9DHK0_EDHAE|nr:hypothetical protein EDEG_03494 [Edhazardia aedis USNM 41457]|eukprot:EJW02070.1 hypothetical protein EDEG_03494 [Edhazardia aedis USNM 41457]
MTDPFHNMTFVFTGDMDMPREDAQQKVIMLGGRVTTAPSGKTTYLVIGANPGPKKLKVAKEHNIKVLNEKEFIEMVSKCEENFDDTTVVNVSKGPKIVSSANKTSESKTTAKVCKEDVEYNNEGHSSYMWCEKYRPQKIEDLVGNQTVIDQLKKYLTGKVNKQAALLSGNPGIGKTTSALVVCRDLGFEVVEFNASDVRNKGEISRQIKDRLNVYALSSSSIKKRVLIMDEIDGMTSDRGGLAELSNIIKKTSVPIICICNDRSNQKIRTLANYCVDLRFRKLDARQMVPRIKWILEKEGKNIRENMINEIVKNSNGDLRYCLNTLQNMCIRETLSHEQISLLTRKNTTKNVFEVVRELFTSGKISEKIDLYFEDYNFVPLMVYENYVHGDAKNIKLFHSAIESMSLSDIVDKRIHGTTQEWSLLPFKPFTAAFSRQKDLNTQKKLILHLCWV